MEELEKKKELIKLLNVPEVADYLVSLLGEIKKKYADEISSYDKLLEGKKNDDNAEELFEKDKSYHFELVREKNNSEIGPNMGWRLLKFKYSEEIEIVKRLFDEFKPRLAHHKPAEGMVVKQENIVIESHSFFQAFEVSFMMSRDDRVVGYVKRIESKNKSGRVSSMIRIPTTYQDFGESEHEMYKQLKHWMKKDPEIRDEILFYFHVLKRQKKNQL